MQTVWVIGRDSHQTVAKLGEVPGLPLMGSISGKQLTQHPEVYQNGIWSIMLPTIPPDEKNLQMLAQNLRSFVQTGGSLLGLQGSATLIQTAFPEAGLRINTTEAGKMTMSVCDPALEEITGSSLTISTEHCWESLQPDADGTFQVYLATETPKLTPVVYSFMSGTGRVFIQPVETRGKAWEDTLSKHLLASALVQSLHLKTRQKQQREHAIPLAEYPMVFPQITPIFPIEFSPAEDKIAMVMLHWDGTSKLHIHIEDELQRMVLNQSSSQSSMVWAASLPGGKWYCTVTQPEKQADIVPAILSVCAAKPFAMRKLPLKPSFLSHPPKRCSACNMPLNPTMRFCPACGRKVN